MLLLGYITGRLEKKSQTVFLVGGQAVETYTAGQFTTGDIDITTTDKKATEELLARLGFERAGMVWLNVRLGIAIHIVGLFPSEGIEKTRTIYAGPYPVRVISVENLIVDRLAAAKFWKSQPDLEQAQVLYTTFKRTLDERYLKEKAKKRGVSDWLSKLALSVLIGKRPRFKRPIPVEKLEKLSENW